MGKNGKKKKRMSSKDFGTLYDALITNDPNKPKVKYKDPDQWRGGA
jgi:hypothetical protein